MDKFLFTDVSENLREQYLSDNCDSIEEIGYTRHFTIDELNQKKEELAEVSISINDIEEEKQEAMTDFKERLKPLNETKKHILDDVKKGSEFVEGECFKFIDHKNKTVGYYDKLGILVSSRAIMPQEMQKTIFNLKTGINE